MFFAMMEKSVINADTIFAFLRVLSGITYYYKNEIKSKQALELSLLFNFLEYNTDNGIIDFVLSSYSKGFPRTHLVFPWNKSSILRYNDPKNLF